MGTEYYIVKPETKEMYGLGRHLNYFTNLKADTYGHEADYDEYECYYDFLLDIVDNNIPFMESMWDETWGTINDFLYEVWTFIEGGKVLLISDVSDNFEKYSDYKEVGSLIDFFERRENERSTFSSDGAGD